MTDLVASHNAIYSTQQNPARVNVHDVRQLIGICLYTSYIREQLLVKQTQRLSGNSVITGDGFEDISVSNISTATTLYYLAPS